MANALYSISTFTYIVVIALILVQDRISHPVLNELEKNYEILAFVVWVFCFQDMIWGLLASMNPVNNTLLFASSSVFHIATVFTTYIWLRFILKYLEEYITRRKLILGIYKVILVVQLALVFSNIFTPVYFIITEEGAYEGVLLRPISFVFQYSVYLAAGLFSLLIALSKKGYEKKRFLSVFAFSLPQIIFGIFQILFTDAPFYAVGYFVSLVMMHLFIVSEERTELRELKQNEFHRQREADSIRYNNLADIDELTGLFNRRKYDRFLEAIRTEGMEDNLVLVSMDVMGTRATNDKLGHAAGDELISGAAGCIKTIFDSFGRAFRTGSDEFSAIIYAGPEELEQIKLDLRETIAKWSGQKIDNLEVLFGYAEHSVYSEVDLNELMRIADRNLNLAKINYYKNLGRDRRSNQEIYNAVCLSYIKILKVNITDDSYEIIKMNNNEPFTGPRPNKLSDWLFAYGKSDLIAEEDRFEFFEKTDLNYIRDFFLQKRNSLVLFYFRKVGNHYRKTMLEFFPAENYTEDNQVLYLFTKDIDK